MTIAHDVSFSNAASSSGTATSLSLTSALPTAGAFIGGFLQAGSVPTITDTQTNAYNVITLGASGGSHFGLNAYFYYTPNPSAVTHAANVITANWATASDAGMMADSWLNVATSAMIDTLAGAFSNSAGAAVNTWTSPNGQGVQNVGSLLLGFAGGDGTTGITWNAGHFNGVIQTAGLGNEPNQPIFDGCYQTGAASGTAYNFQGTMTGTACAMFAALMVISPTPVVPPPVMYQGQSGFASPW